MGMENISRNSGAGNKRRRPDFFTRFRRNDKGSVAVEFSILILPFTLLTFAILETCISFAAQTVMINATDDIARQFRTGQLQPGHTEAEKQELRDTIFTQICGRMEVIVSKGCPGLLIDLRSFDHFSQAASYRFTIVEDKIVLQPGNIREEDFAIEPGPTMSRNILRVFYKWPIITDFMSRYIASLDGGKTLHFASFVWQNEPF
ncbi:TadE/TadG family type IV pilus assembly protein [Aquamicrobium segne]|uniref:TadE/TadG family type IV pilus assembly protein n=1 Tax=Aquamicrobium segne TaxID=469547 RepID=A0ABW0GU38_9HYPH